MAKAHVPPASKALKGGTTLNPTAAFVTVPVLVASAFVATDSLKHAPLTKALALLKESRPLRISNLTVSQLATPVKYFLLTEGTEDYLNNKTEYPTLDWAMKAAREGWEVWKKRDDMLGVTVIDSNGKELLKLSK
jgi:hypothetical protein